MKNRLVLLTLAIALLLSAFTACGDVTYANISAQNPYSKGTQTIEITASSAISDIPTVKFKQSISVSDIVLGEALIGKTVTKVEYKSETSIAVTLDGNTKAEGGDGVYGTITVKHSGLDSEGNSTCTVNLLAPLMAVKDYFGGGTTNKYMITANIILNEGEFTDKATSEYISLEDGVTGELTVSLSDGVLTVNVTDCSVKNPSLVMKPQVTTFGKEYVIKLTPYGTARL